MNVNEAAKQFQRRANDVLEQAEAIKLGMDVITIQSQRIAQLEKHIVDTGGQVPAPPSATPPNMRVLDDGK